MRPESTTSLAAYEINGAVPRSFQIYNVADLLAVGSGGSRLAGVDARQTAVEPLDPSSLMAHIRARSGGDAAWSDAQIEFSQGQLFVDASGGLHDQVRRILAELRRRKLEKPS